MSLAVRTLARGATRSQNEHKCPKRVYRHAQCQSPVLCCVSCVSSEEIGTTSACAHFAGAQAPSIQPPAILPPSHPCGQSADGDESLLPCDGGSGGASTWCHISVAGVNNHSERLLAFAFVLNHSCSSDGSASDHASKTTIGDLAIMPVWDHSSCAIMSAGGHAARRRQG